MEIAPTSAGFEVIFTSLHNCFGFWVRSVLVAKVLKLAVHKLPVICLVQPSYMCNIHANQASCTAQGLLSKLVTTLMNSDIQIISKCKELTQLLSQVSAHL